MSLNLSANKNNNLNKDWIETKEESTYFIPPTNKSNSLDYKDKISSEMQNYINHFKPIIKNYFLSNKNINNLLKKTQKEQQYLLDMYVERYTRNPHSNATKFALDLFKYNIEKDI